jgi:hypothetical protein
VWSSKLSDDGGQTDASSALDKWNEIDSVFLAQRVWFEAERACFAISTKPVAGLAKKKKKSAESSRIRAAAASLPLARTDRPRHARSTDDVFGTRLYAPSESTFAFRWSP